MCTSDEEKGTLAAIGAGGGGREGKIKNKICGPGITTCSMQSKN